MAPRTAFELFESAGALVAASRLLLLGLAKRLPSLFAYLVLLFVLNLILGLLNYESNEYFWAYVILEPVKCVLSVMAVRELFTLIFENYPGIRTFGRWVMCGGVVLALAISLVVTRFFWTGGAQGRSKMYYFGISQRSVLFALAFVIVAILLALSRYPLKLHGNTLISSTCFSALFLSDACRLLIDGLAPPPYLYNRYVDWSQSVFAGVCLVTWAYLLKPKETVPARVSLSIPREDHLLQELNALNQVMTRAARR